MPPKTTKRRSKRVAAAASQNRRTPQCSRMSPKPPSLRQGWSTHLHQAIYRRALELTQLPCFRAKKIRDLVLHRAAGALPPRHRLTVCRHPAFLAQAGGFRTDYYSFSMYYMLFRSELGLDTCTCLRFPCYTTKYLATWRFASTSKLSRIQSGPSIPYF
jgi:hypothetical protein